MSVNGSTFGRSYRKAGIINYEPPRLGKPFAALVPQADGDGIDILECRCHECRYHRDVHWLESPGGRHSSERQIIGADQLVIPFAATKKAREDAGDPRPSLEERYDGQADYLTKVRDAGMSLAKSGFLLERDIPAVVDTAKKYWDGLPRVPTRASRNALSY